MSIAVVKYLSRIGTRALRPPLYALARTSANEPWAPKQQQQQQQASSQEGDKGRPKAGSCPPTVTPVCPEPPPCPPMPHCPPTICPPVVDPNNPCNYCPPPCIDPDYPDITKLKKLQCLFQQDDDLPIYLKKGNMDALLYQLTIVLTLLSLIMAFVTTFKISVK